jgi:hypothetical protein
LPLPTGPMMPLTNASDLKNLATVGEELKFNFNPATGLTIG